MFHTLILKVGNFIYYNIKELVAIRFICKKANLNFWHVHTLWSVFVNSPPAKPEVILTNFFAQPTVLLVRITSREIVSLLFYCANIVKSENAMLWRMLSRLETCIVYCCIWSVTLAKSIVPRKTWRKLWQTSKSPHAFAMCSIRTDLLKQENEKIDSL
jgi:hypothetical protein